MAVFKILRGKEATLPSTITDGYIYFCKDTKNYYIDYILDGTLTRSKIAAGYADKLRYTKDSTTVEIEPSTILTDSNYATKIGAATESKTGLMSAADKDKLDGIATNANKTVVDSALSSTSTNPVENKVVKAALDTKAGLDVATSVANGLMSSTDKSKIDGIAAGAEVNQNAYSKITVGTTEIAATSKTDNITIVAGNNVTLTPDASNKKYTISAKDTTYPTATTTTDGLMSKSDKIKLDGIEEGANKTIVDSALSTSSTNPVQNKIVKAALDGKAASDHTHSVYVNQNAFSNVKVGSTTVAADTATDTLTLVAGTNVTITPDATNDKITIAATDTTYPVATQSADGLMSSADKAKLDGVATGAQVNVIEGVTSNSLTVGSITSKKIQLDIEWIEF